MMDQTRLKFEWGWCGELKARGEAKCIMPNLEVTKESAVRKLMFSSKLVKG